MGTDSSTFMSSKAPRVVKGVLDNGLAVQEAGDKVLWPSGALREEIALVTDPGSLWQRWEGTPHHLEVTSTARIPFWLENRLS